MRKNNYTEEEAKNLKRCGRCQKIKPFTEFGICRGRPRVYCYDCRRVRQESERVALRDRLEKLCPGCNEIKPIGQFRKKGREDDRNATVAHYCRECSRENCRKRFREKIKSGKAREEYKERYKIARWQKLLKQYGITQEQYEAIEEKQGFLCAICRNQETIFYKDVLCRLVVDHDHSTGMIRGLLCRACNIALGNFREDAERLKRAIDYLNLYKQDER